MKYAICNEVYGDWPFEKVCRHAKAAGYTGIEIAPFTLADNVRQFNATARSSINNTAAEFELEITGLHWLLAGTDGLHLTSNDSSVRDKTLDYLSELTKFCHDIGGEIMVLGSPNERNLAGNVSLEQGKANAIDILKRLAPVLEDLNVTLAIEPLGPEETNFIMTAEEGIDLAREVNSSHVRLHLDVKAMSTEQQSIERVIRESGDWLAHFHANDPNRQGPGSGIVHFKPVLAALNDINYAGWVSVEVFDYSPGIEQLVCGSIDYLKRIDSNCF